MNQYYIRLTSSLIKQSRVTCSPLSSDSDFELPDASSIYKKSKPEVLLISDNSDDDSDFELPPSVPSTSRGHNHSYQSLPLQCSTPKTVQSTTYTPSPSSNTSNTLQSPSPLPVSTETPSTSRGRNRSYRSLSLHRSTSTVQPIPSPISSTNTLQLPSPLPVSETPSTSRRSCQSSSLHHSTSTVQPTSSTSNTLVSSDDSTQAATVVNLAVPFNCDLESEHFSSFTELPFMEDVSPSLETLCERYSEFTPDAIKALYEVYGEDASLVYSCLAEGVPLQYLLQQLNSHFITVDSSEAPRIRIEKDDEWVDVAFTLYKGRSFRKDAPVTLVMLDEPVIDAGGVSCQFFLEVYKSLAEGRKKIFEDLDLVKPVYNLGIAGVLKFFGIMLAHTIIVHGIGFPYFSPSCYYYMLGHYEIAVTKVLRKEASGKEEYVLNQVSQLY